MTQRSPLALLWLVNIALAAALLAWWMWPGLARWRTPAAVTPDYASALQEASLPGHLKQEDYPTIVTAPLFETTRRWPDEPPPPPKPKEEPAKVEPPKNLLDDARVLGIYDRAGQGVVILEVEGRPHRLRLGQKLEDWTLVAIDKLSVRMSHAKHPARVLTLKRSENNPEPEQAAKAAQGAQGGAQGANPKAAPPAAAQSAGRPFVPAPPAGMRR